jgi:zinc ribbon protein
MFFIAGTRGSAKALGQFSGPCQKCAKPTMHTAVRVTRYVTLFFVPLIPIGQTYLVVCNLCGLKLKAEGGLRERLIAWEKSGPSAAPPLPAGGDPRATASP